MEKNVLTGIERELVLQYLLDGNVPVTVTPFEEIAESDDKIKPLSSAVFPIAIKAHQISVLKEGIILLTNPPKSISDFQGKKVKVEFYFNRVGLFFITKMKMASSGPALVIPEVINRIQDAEIEQKYDFKSFLYFSNENNESVLDCFPASDFKLLSRPRWNSIPLEKQKLAKAYLEQFVEDAKKTGKAGNGLQLINIARYLVQENDLKIQSVEGRVKPFDILFLNHERIVLGFEKNDSFMLQTSNDYKLQISFSLLKTPMITRDIQVVSYADIIYKNNEETRFACDLSFKNLKEEDLRFLYEKATSTLFN